MPKPLSVYLGGPDVFLPNALEIYLAKTVLVLEAGFIPAIPGDVGIHGRKGEAPTEKSRDIFKADVATMQYSDFGLFNLTPFRGPSADVGTAFELGYMTASGKPVFGYSNIVGDYVDRIAPKQAILADGQPPAWRDQDGCAIETYGNADNLMLDGALDLHGALMVRYDAPLPQRLTDMTAFKLCLKVAQDYFVKAAAVKVG